MPTNPQVLTTELVQSAIDSAYDWHGVELTEDQMRVVIDSAPYFRQDLIASNGCGDTVTREYLGSALAALAVGPGAVWPCYGDSKRVAAEFFTAYRAGAERLGWKMQSQLAPREDAPASPEAASLTEEQARVANQIDALNPPKDSK